MQHKFKVRGDDGTIAALDKVSAAILGGVAAENAGHEPPDHKGWLEKVPGLFPVGSMALLNADSFLFYFPEEPWQIRNSDNANYFVVLFSTISN